MKKKMLVSISIALVMVAALAVTALAGASVSGPATVKPGDTIQVTISGTGQGVNGTVTTSGLECTGVSSQLSAPGAFVLLPDYGTSSVTYTYRVTAASGQVSVTLSNVTESVNDQPQAAAGSTWSADVIADTTPTDEPSQQPSGTPTDEPSQAPSGTPSGEPSGDASASVKPGTSASVKPGAATADGKDKLPKTGDATMDLWVLAVIAAGAVSTAVIAGKKVFSGR